MGEVLETCFPSSQEAYQVVAMTQILIAKDEHRKAVSISLKQHDCPSIYNKDIMQARNALRWLPLSSNLNQLLAINWPETKVKDKLTSLKNTDVILTSVYTPDYKFYLEFLSSRDSRKMMKPRLTMPGIVWVSCICPLDSNDLEKWALSVPTVYCWQS